ncbi:MAG: DUF2085 domain-containing protein [Anaerolineae bacterium]|nr:DUF2085 domain-containing protein [Anaerolineae bacterium]
MTETPRPSRGLRLNLWLLKVTQRWLRYALVIIGLYAGLPWIAPTLMHLGLTGPAGVLYTLYSPMCHQFAFRSIFLYGEQPFYPRAAAFTPYQPFEQFVYDDPDYLSSYAFYYQLYARQPLVGPVSEADLAESFTIWMQFAARDFRGSADMGYKTTLCARDVAIYGMLFVGGCLYALPGVRRRLRPVPLWLYVIVGLGPIGLDGFSQLLSYPPFDLWPVRETAPFFRVATGALFGLMNVWLAFPYIDMSMQDTRRQILLKLARAGVPLPPAERPA